MQILNVTNLPIYLPYDKAPVPFGDPLAVSAFTIAAPGVATVPGYVPVAGDAVSFSVSAGGTLPTGLTVGTVYYVVSPSTDTFSVSATKGGGAITTTGSFVGPVFVHLLSNQTDGVTIPFKPGYTVCVLNLSGGTLVLQGASDSGSTYGAPAGPGSFSTIASVLAGSAALATLNFDWIRVSTAGTLVLLQN